LAPLLGVAVTQSRRRPARWAPALPTRPSAHCPFLVASGLAPLLGVAVTQSRRRPARWAPALLTRPSAHCPFLVASGLAPLLGATVAPRVQRPPGLAPAMLTRPSAHHRATSASFSGSIPSAAMPSQSAQTSLVAGCSEPQRAFW